MFSDESHSSKKLVDTARTEGPRRTLCYATGEYKQLVVVYSTELWVKPNHNSAFYSVAWKVVPTAANLSEATVRRLTNGNLDREGSTGTGPTAAAARHSTRPGASPTAYIPIGPTGTNARGATRAVASRASGERAGHGFLIHDGFDQDGAGQDAQAGGPPESERPETCRRRRFLFLNSTGYGAARGRRKKVIAAKENI
ncbi:hypothetical protein V6N13_149745 [Hibiscus sabdariffa]